MWIDVTAAPYYAKGNGTDDDTAAIQAALDDAAFGSDSERNAVYFPPGTYRITARLNLTHCQGVRLIGVGNVQGTPPYLGGYAGRQSGAVLFWDGEADDPDNTLLRIFGSYFCSLESLTFVGATPQRYKFSSSTDDSEPGDGFLRFDSGTFSAISEIYVDNENAFLVTISDWLDRLDDVNFGRLTIENQNGGALRIFKVSSVTDATTYRKIVVTPIQSVGGFANNDPIIVDFVSTPVSPQPYTFSDSTSTNPANGTLRFNNGTFGSITQIYADDLSAVGQNIGAWLDAIDDQADVRVTVMKAEDSSVQRVFKVTGVANSSGYRTITVTPIYSSGSLANNDKIVLICSRHQSIRDRAGALVEQQSDTGWAAGHMLIENCFFQDAVEGVRLSGTAPLFNCDINTFMHCTFNSCDAGIKCNSAQVLMNIIVNGDFSGCKIGIDQVLGGDTHVFGASMSGEVGELFMRIQGGGINASSFELKGVRLEMKPSKPSLLETSDTNQYDNIDVVIDSFSWSGKFYPDEYSSGATYDAGDFVRLDSTIYESLAGSNHGNSPPTSPTQWAWLGDWVPPIRLSENTNCTIRGSIVKGPFAEVTGATAAATLKLDNCRLHYLESDVVTTGTNGLFKLVDCTNGSGEPIDDTGNWPPDAKDLRVASISRSFGTVSAAASFRLPPMPGFTGKVTAARLVVAEDVAASNSDYWIFRLKNKGTDGTEDTDVLATGNGSTTKSTGGLNGGGGLSDNAVTNFTLNATVANRDVSAGEILVFEITTSGTPADDLADGVVEIDVEPTA